MRRNFLNHIKCQNVLWALSNEPWCRWEEVKETGGCITWRLFQDISEQGCIFRLTCSHRELTKDHVLTSAYVKIFRTVTRNTIKKSVLRKKDSSWLPLNKHAMNIWLNSLRISWRTGKHLHVLHVLPSRMVGWHKLCNPVSECACYARWCRAWCPSGNIDGANWRGALFETFVSTDMGRAEGSKGSLVKENEGNHRHTSLTRICKKMLQKEKRKGRKKT